MFGNFLYDGCKWILCYSSTNVDISFSAGVFSCCSFLKTASSTASSTSSSGVSGRSIAGSNGSGASGAGSAAASGGGSGAASSGGSTGSAVGGGGGAAAATGSSGAGVLAAASSGSEAFAFANAYPKIRATIFAPVQPSTSGHTQNRDFLMDYITNPRRRPEPHVLRQLSESAQLRYSFVCNVILQVNLFEQLDENLGMENFEAHSNIVRLHSNSGQVLTFD